MPTILYIEDNLYNTQLIQRLLAQRPNLTLLPSSSGREGFNLAKDRSPDLILLDVHLPDVTGFDVFTSLRTDSSTSSIPVVILSADATPGQNRRFLDAGADDYLIKPLDLSSLLHVIDRLLNAGPVTCDKATEA
jgi:CheY-like chemotaxis protein